MDAGEKNPVSKTKLSDTLKVDLINPFPNKSLFLCVCSTSLMKTLYVSHRVFYPSGKLSTIFIKFKNVVCELFQFGGV